MEKLPKISPQNFLTALKKYRKQTRAFIFLLTPILLFFTLNLLFPLQINIPYSTVITASDGTVINAFLSKDHKWRMKLEQHEISPVLKKAMLLKEDKYFYYHPGVNPIAMARAFVKNTISGKTTSGASTITMQVARLLSPKKRTYQHKLVEVFRSLQLEWQFSKDEILLLYLNLVPYGGNIEGVKAASILYFHQSPEKLSLAQAVTLTVIPNKPSSLRIGLQNPKTKAFRNKWLQHFRWRKSFPDDDIEDALQEPIEAYRQQAPKVAPHFSYRLFKQFPEQATIRTTLNLEVQEKVEKLAYNYMQRLRYKNIHNAAVLVINNETREVEAYLGSADFTDAANGGQVDGIRAIRSPGSTLKPFLYAVGIEKGLITPKQKITDVPVDYSGYRPKNYHGDYNGNISIEYALATSLNVPAVKVLDQLGVHTFVEKMKQAGFSDVGKKGDELGLSLILGGCGVTLEELTLLYSSFAARGKLMPVKWRAEDSISESKQLFSEPTAFMINGILTQLLRPDLPHNFHSSSRLPKIAWKTGTSYGRRDAWSIGFNQKYTVGVWVGNFSGEGVPELNGTESATPLLFDIFNSIDYNSSAGWFAPPKMALRRVCTETGLPVNNFCTDQAVDFYLPGISAVAKCRHLKQVPVSVDEQFAFCTTCQPVSGYVQKWYPNHAPELLNFYDANQIPYQHIPVHNPVCSRIFSENAPVIVSPASEMEYLLEPDGRQKLMLQANAHNEVKQLFWYINDKLLKAASATENIFFEPKYAGHYKISCTDDQGRNTDSYVTVGFLR